MSHQTTEISDNAPSATPSKFKLAKQKAKSLLDEMKVTWRADGIRGLYKKYGFKLFALFFVYYLIRDVTLYILIPWFIAKKALE